ncbi:hypothetical protein FRB90_009072 [Tulasnella sp. 427]|nr:hypothetical protein FRB90_009072 [Tulasnella sp. 427]
MLPILQLRPAVVGHVRSIIRSQPQIQVYRSFSAVRPKFQQPAVTTSPPAAKGKAKEEDDAFYRGPLTKTFQSLKVFSLSSLALCCSVSPFIYLVDANMATSARTGLVVFAITTSSFSTSLVGWLARPYAISMRRLTPTPASAASDTTQFVAPGAVEIMTKNVFLQERRTKVYDPIFLGPTKRRFAKWELLESLIVDTSRDTSPNPHRKAGQTEVAAETFDRSGKLKGRWLIRWRKQEGAESDNVLVGTAFKQGAIERNDSSASSTLSTPSLPSLAGGSFTPDATSLTNPTSVNSTTVASPGDSSVDLNAGAADLWFIISSSLNDGTPLFGGVTDDPCAEADFWTLVDSPSTTDSLLCFPSFSYTASTEIPTEASGSVDWQAVSSELSFFGSPSPTPLDSSSTSEERDVSYISSEADLISLLEYACASNVVPGIGECEGRSSMRDSAETKELTVNQTSLPSHSISSDALPLFDQLSPSSSLRSSASPHPTQPFPPTFTTDGAVDPPSSLPDHSSTDSPDITIFDPHMYRSTEAPQTYRHVFNLKKTYGGRTCNCAKNVIKKSRHWGSCPSNPNRPVIECPYCNGNKMKSFKGGSAMANLQKHVKTFHPGKPVPRPRPRHKP